MKGKKIKNQTRLITDRIGCYAIVCGIEKLLTKEQYINCFIKCSFCHVPYTGHCDIVNEADEK